MTFNANFPHHIDVKECVGESIISAVTKRAFCNSDGRDKAPNKTQSMSPAVTNVQSLAGFCKVKCSLELQPTNYNLCWPRSTVVNWKMFDFFLLPGCSSELFLVG